MTASPDLLRELHSRFGALFPLAVDMRLGQLMATLGWLGEDMTGRNLWDIEDEELLNVVERFHGDLARRNQSVPVTSNAGQGGAGDRE
jgi:hypothetical protein